MRAGNKLSLTAVSVLYAGLALILWSMGRSWWCSCHGLTPWTWEVISRHNSQHIIDWYTFSHIIHGVIFYWLSGRVFPKSSLAARVMMSAAVEAGWEMLENTPFVIERYRTATMALDYFGDSIINSLSDLTACLLGFYIAWRMPVRSCLLMVVVFELFTLACIRDNLTLNVVMLLWPIEAIKTWQAGL